jgi:hypothetical protein
MERFNISDNVTFFVRNNPDGFGYEIIRKEIGDDKRIKSFKVIFHSSDREQTKRMFELIKAGKEPNEEPETNFSPRLLIIKEKHYDYHFFVTDVNHLNQVCFEYLKSIQTGCSPYRKYDLQEEKITQQYIDDCPDERLKNELQSKLDSTIKYNKEMERHNKIVELLNKRVEEDDNSCCYEILGELESGYIELTNFDN